jgi:hypothetical protein
VLKHELQKVNEELLAIENAVNSKRSSFKSLCDLELNPLKQRSQQLEYEISFENQLHQQLTDQKHVSILFFKYFFSDMFQVLQDGKNEAQLSLQEMLLSVSQIASAPEGEHRNLKYARIRKLIINYVDIPTGEFDNSSGDIEKTLCGLLESLVNECSAIQMDIEKIEIAKMSTDQDIETLEKEIDCLNNQWQVYVSNIETNYREAEVTKRFVKYAIEIRLKMHFLCR